MGMEGMKVKIYYHHTDSGGVVYYARYLNFLEEARTEYLADRGVSVKALSDSGTFFVVARQEVDYKFPARYGDVLSIETRISEVSAVRVNFENEIRNQNNHLILKAKTVLVCVGSDFKPKAIPDEFRSLLA
jgi:acyl-CoA thioester hydrolase